VKIYETPVSTAIVFENTGTEFRAIVRGEDSEVRRAQLRVLVRMAWYLITKKEMKK